jgi:hypothetical protein
VARPMVPPAKPCDGKVVIVVLVAALDPTADAIGVRAPSRIFVGGCSGTAPSSAIGVAGRPRRSMRLNGFWLALP